MTPLFLGPVQAQLLPLISVLIWAALNAVGVAGAKEAGSGANAAGGGAGILAGDAESLNTFMPLHALNARVEANIIVNCNFVIIFQ